MFFQRQLGLFKLLVQDAELGIRLPDFVLGLHAAISLTLLSIVARPPASGFLAALVGIGFLGGAQLVTRKDAPIGLLNASELLGGALGALLAGTVLVPLFGIMPVATGLFILKAVVYLF